MTMLSIRNFVSSFRRPLAFFVVVISLSPAHGLEISRDTLIPKIQVSGEGVNGWSDFAARVDEQTIRDRNEGTAYLVSGAVVLIGGAIGYNNANDSVEKVAYSLSQSLGIGGMGYGAYLFTLGGEDRHFVKMVRSTTLMNATQKDELTKAYLTTRDERKSKEAWIRVIAHGLVAGVNLYNASRETNENVRTGLYLFGGANVLAAFSYAF